jgi:hypothetical protein
LESVFTGFTSGVIVRSFSVLLVMAALGAGVLNARFIQKGRFAGKPWVQDAVSGPGAVIAGGLAIIIAVVLVHATLTEAGKPLYYQPWLQGLVIVCVGVIIAIVQKWHTSRHGIDTVSILEQPPAE